MSARAAPARLLKSHIKPCDPRDTDSCRSLVDYAARLLVPAAPPSAVIRLSIQCNGDAAALPAHGIQIIDHNGTLLRYVNLDDVTIGPGPTTGYILTALVLVTIPDHIDTLELRYTSGLGQYVVIARLHHGLSGWHSEGFGVTTVAPSSGPTKYFFVSGTAKSGTTWVQQLLNAHPEIMCLGEGGFALFAQAVAASSVETSFRSWYPLTSGKDYLKALCFRAVARECFEQIGSCYPVMLVGDRTPAEGCDYPTIRAAFPEARIIWCVRHPLDVIVSRVYHEWNLFRSGRADLCVLNPEQLRMIDSILSNGANGGTKELFRDLSLARHLIDMWVADNACVVSGAATDPLLLRVRYEDLLADIENTMRILLAFLAVGTTDAAIKEFVQRSSFERQSGGRVRGVEDVRSFYRKGVVGDYRQYLSPQQAGAMLAYVEEKMPGGLAVLGYHM